MTLPAMYIANTRITPILWPQGYDNADGAIPQGVRDRIDLDISTAGQTINNACRRHFDLISETRTFDAPAATHLPIADLQPSPPPVLTFAGATLVAGTDYYLQPQITALHPAYQAVVRVQSGFVRRWGYRPQPRVGVTSVTLSRGGWEDEYLLPVGAYGLYAPAPSEQVVTIAGTWGYAAGVPGPIQQAAEILTLRLWYGRTLLFGSSDSAGAPAPGAAPPLLLTADVLALLAPYVKPEYAEVDE